MWLVAGLGNPGKQYSRTRHNVGFMVVDALAKELAAEFSGRKFAAEFSQVKVGREKIIIIKPQTYMNRSGEAVAQLVNYFKVPSHRLLTVYDDFNLELGVVRLRLRGSAGGHNGVQSVIETLGTADFPRLRIGVGKPSGDRADFVLAEFALDEKAILQGSISRAVKIVNAVLRDGLAKTVSYYQAIEA